MSQYFSSGPTLESSSRLRRNAIDISALTNSMKPISTRSGRRNAVDFTTLVKSDWWHSSQRHTLVSRVNYHTSASVFFGSAAEQVAGVAMTELAMYQDLAYPSEAITDLLPQAWFPRRPFVQLILNWPGYNHLQIRKKLFFFNHTGGSRTLLEVAHDIAEIYRAFIHRCHASAPGPNAITFGHLRLLRMQLCDIIEDCERWVADVTYVQS
ncbi:hypothetical protein BDP27DRAFT_1313412 [Rhodocollybia butyracea]|uniref:Uncharacterized protein n=1 Tax=Rhodocollybia butyracea TaxID=206335 RepID=A0A9P5Q1A7_9AGAR|nr:hypothetical protein BDP27DRAFT_1313412 [Rhodocollybia butyracea]